MSTVDILAPKLGLTVTELEVTEWHKPVGSPVEAGELLLTVTMDKADVEIEATASGTLVEQVVGVGEVAVVGDVLGRIGSGTDDGSAPPVAQPKTPETAPPAPGSPPAPDLPASTGGPGTAVTAGTTPVAAPAPAGTPERRFASPLARRAARELNVPLGEIEATGPGGRIVRDDVLAAARRLEAATPAPAPAATEDGLTELPQSPIRKVIARRMAAASTDTAAAGITMVCDMTAALDRQRRARVANIPATVTHVLLHAVGRALAHHPRLNGFYVDGKHLSSATANIGLAVDVDGDLVVPVLERVDELTLVEVVESARAAVARARSGSLTPADASSGTFTVSNLGMFGVDVFTPIINAPQVAILGVGTIADELAVVNGEVHVRPTLRLSLTFDHRVVDGADAARFLGEVRSLLEQASD